MGTVAVVYRYPVKSMLGEQLDSAELGESCLAGDRAYAVVDLEDGRIASAKHPRKWSRLLELRAAYQDGLGSPVVVSFPTPPPRPLPTRTSTNGCRTSSVGT